MLAAEWNTRERVQVCVSVCTPAHAVCTSYSIIFVYKLFNPNRHIIFHAENVPHPKHSGLH